MLSPASLSCKRKREDQPDHHSAKRRRPPSPPPSSACDRPPNSPPADSAYAHAPACARALATAAWVDGTAAVAMPPERQPDPPPSDVASASADSRASSRSRITQTKAYRGLVRKAGIDPDTWRPMPRGVRATVDVALAGAPPALDAHLRRTASRFCERARELAEDDANESGWKGAFSSMVDELRLECGGAAIKLALDQDWCEELLPQPELFAPGTTVPQRRSRDSQGSPAVHASPRSNIKLKKPRPDLQLSLAKRALTGRVEAGLLDQFFDTVGLACNPSGQPEGGYFPFLVCELKSDATGGNFFGAQNQACVAAATALRIFGSLQALQSPELSDADRSSPVFAICSEGSRFELFAYYREPGQAKYVGRGVKQWKTINAEDAHDLVKCVAGIIEWARHDLKTKVVQAIDAIWERSRDEP